MAYIYNSHIYTYTIYTIYIHIAYIYCILDNTYKHRIPVCKERDD